jgi:hypothetical protein
MVIRLYISFTNEFFALIGQFALIFIQHSYRNERRRMAIRLYIAFTNEFFAWLEQFNLLFTQY